MCPIIIWLRCFNKSLLLTNWILLNYEKLFKFVDLVPLGLLWCLQCLFFYSASLGFAEAYNIIKIFSFQLFYIFFEIVCLKLAFTFHGHFENLFLVFRSVFYRILCTFVGYYWFLYQVATFFGLFLDYVLFLVGVHYRCLCRLPRCTFRSVFSLLYVLLLFLDILLMIIVVSIE